MKTQHYLVKEKINVGFVMITGTIEGNTFKTNNKEKIDTRFLSKDEKMFSNALNARVHAEMLNNFAIVK
jgi:hypothetical protein